MIMYRSALGGERAGLLWVFACSLLLCAFPLKLLFHEYCILLLLLRHGGEVFLQLIKIPLHLSSYALVVSAFKDFH